MSRLPFKIKICGVTSVEDAQLAATAGADAIGLNFYSQSKRFVPLARAAAIIDATPAEITKVGVFVNASIGEIETVVRRLSIDMIQLHGSETPDFLAKLRRICMLPVVRAFRWQEDEGHAIETYLSQCESLDCLPAAMLIDSFSPTQFGGTGVVADWESIAAWAAAVPHRLPLVLAGGLNPENVNSAIQSVSPDAVDTASGVEWVGRKHAKLAADFVKSATQAFNSLKA